MPKTLPAEVLREREQLLKEQGPSARVKTSYLDLPALRGHIGRPYSSRRISINQMYEMQTDAVLAFAQLVSMISLFMAEWHIECASARKAEFLDKALRRIYGRTVIQFCLSWNFGYQALVKAFGLANPGWRFINKDAEGGPAVEEVWDGGPRVPALIWEPFVPLRPESVAPIYDDSTGRFDGIKFDGTGVYGFPSIPLLQANTDKEIARKVDLKHSLWVVNQRDGQFGSVWGWPRTGFAFKFWWAYEMTLGILNRSMERKGDPVVVVRFPNGNSVDASGNERPNQEIAFEIGELARSGSVLAIPSEVWDADTGEGKGPKWSVDYLKAEEKFEALKDILGYLDTAKFRSMMVSELSVAEGSGGTSSRNVAATTGVRSAEVQNIAQAEFDSIINQYMLPQLADENFPELSHLPARKVTQTFGEGEAELAKTVFESFANANASGLPVDWGALAERFKLPTLSLEAIVEKQRELAAQAEQKTPPPVDAPANGPAGVDRETGFYYDARERIELADDATLIDGLPKTKHYEDRKVLAETRIVRKIWRDLLKEQYEDFAAHLESAELSDVDFAGLAEEDPEAAARRVAEQIVKAWRYSASRTAAAVKRTAAALTTIFDRAGRLELKRSNLADDAWNPEEKELADWINANAGALVKRIDDTTRDQLRTFLVEQVKADKNAPEIAKAARLHFTEFPDWRADRLARTEVRKFYNAATAFAAQVADAQVQMLDGRHGPTDKDCVKRNGKIVTPQEFLQEDAKEHPNGTLAGRILRSKVKLTVQRVKVDEDNVYAARCDRATGIIYLHEDLSEEAEGHYLVQVGDWLENTVLTTAT